MLRKNKLYVDQIKDQQNKDKIEIEQFKRRDVTLTIKIQELEQHLHDKRISCMKAEETATRLQQQIDQLTDKQTILEKDRRK